MILDDFAAADPIFIDAKIWTYFALNTEPFQTSCTTFLHRVETNHIKAVISEAVLNEIFYAILVGKAAAELQTTRIKQIHRELRQDASLAAKCYQSCLDFTKYLDALQKTGLQILPVDYQIQVASLEIGRRNGLLPTDALHVAVCQQYSIQHVATADAHFQNIPALTMWQPSSS
jgi:predicted nucleic acid-binding protein